MSKVNLGRVVGEDGKSAYQIWLEQGNTGTEQDFLNSLGSSESESGSGNGNGLTTAQINALDEMFKKCAYTEDISEEYETFKRVFGIGEDGNEDGNEGGNEGGNEKLFLSSSNDESVYKTAFAFTYAGLQVVPAAIIPEFDETNKTCSLSGHTVSKITIKAVKAGKITIGKVDLSAYGTGVYMSLINPQEFIVQKGINTLEVSLALGEHETIGIHDVNDEGLLAYAHDAKEKGEVVIVTNDRYKSGEFSIGGWLSVYTKIYVYEEVE